MSAIDLIRQVEALGGRVMAENGNLRIISPTPVPAELMDALAAEKPAVMVALGAPFDLAVASILTELRPNLPPNLRNLPDSALLAMVNWTIMHAWFKTLKTSR